MSMIEGYLYIGDIVYNPFTNEICEVTGFNTGEKGERQICFRVGKNKYNQVANWAVFKYFEPLDQALKEMGEL